MPVPVYRGPIYGLPEDRLCMEGKISGLPEARWSESESNRIESHRQNLSGSWHSGRSQHGQYLGYTGSSVQDMPHQKHSNQLNPEPLQ